MRLEISKEVGNVGEMVNLLNDIATQVKQGIESNRSQGWGLVGEYNNEEDHDD